MWQLVICPINPFQLIFIFEWQELIFVVTRGETMKELLAGLVLAGHCLFAGIMFGWASLQLILEEEEVMRSGCDPDEVECASQNAKFNLVYTVTTTLFM